MATPQTSLGGRTCALAVLALSCAAALSAQTGHIDTPAHAIAIDGSGRVYLGGSGNAFLSATAGGPELFRMNLGENTFDAVRALVRGGNGNLYATGSNGAGGFVVRLDGDGERTAETKLPTEGRAIAVDAAGAVYVGGFGYVRKLDADLNLVYSAPVTGRVNGIAVDDNGAVYIAKAGAVAKLSPDGNKWEFEVNFGAAVPRAIAVDSLGVYVAGETTSPDFYWTDAPINRLQGTSDGFVARLSHRGMVEWGEYIGGEGADGANAMALDGRGRLLIGGSAMNGGFLAQFDTAGVPLGNRRVEIPVEALALDGEQVRLAGGPNVVAVNLSSLESAPSAAGKAKAGVATPGTIFASAGTPQSTAVSAAYGKPLEVTVVDSNGVYVSGVTVTYTVTSFTGASATLSSSTAVTDSSGRARVTATANGTAGAFVVNVTAPGAGNTATFYMSNVNTAAGGTCTVTAGSDNASAGSLRNQIAVCGAGATINLSVASILSAPIPIQQSVTIQGSVGTPISGNSTTRIFFIRAGVADTVNLRDVTLAGGSAAGGRGGSGFRGGGGGAGIGGAIYLNSGNLNLTNVTVQSNSATGGAGGSGVVAGATGNGGGGGIGGDGGTGIGQAFGNGGGGGIFGNSGGSGNDGAGGDGGGGLGSINGGHGGGGGGNSGSSGLGGGGGGSFGGNANFGGASGGSGSGFAGNAGGGAGLGGAIYAETGTTLNLFGGIFQSSQATGGSGGGANATAGQGKGGALFIQSGATARNFGAAFTSNSAANAGTGTACSVVTGAGSRDDADVCGILRVITMTATGGTPQSATVNTAFATALQVTVVDSANSPISGVPVTFTAPGSGASGTFASSATVNTNASGIAVAPTFTANTVAGTYNVTATLGGLTATFALTNTAGAAAAIATFAGTPQSAAVNTAFATALQARVTDSFGNNVSGASVTFAAPGGGGASGSFTGSPTVTTNSAGVATAPTFTANSVTGTYTVTAGIPAGASANFSLTNTAGAPASLTLVAGNNQAFPVNTAFGALQVQARDGFNNLVTGANVTFTAPGSGPSGRFSNSTASIAIATDSSGIASASYTANTIAGGPYTVTATLGALSVNFSETNLPGPPATITINAGSPQSTVINTVFATLMQGTLRDAFSNVIPNTAVTFAAPGSGASGTFPGSLTSTAVNTNASGVVTAPAFTANGTGGTYNVVASAGAASVNFVLTNLPQVPITITTVPAGLNITVDGNTFAAPQTFLWLPGTQHTIATPSPQNVSGGSQQSWVSWSDSGAVSHSITTPSAAATFTANFQTQYQLNIVFQPVGAGTTNPPPGTFFPAGSIVNVQFIPNTGFSLTGLTGTIPGDPSTSSFLINGPRTLTANFVAVEVCSYVLGRNSASHAGTGDIGAVQVQTTSGCAWNATTTSEWLKITKGSGTGKGPLYYTVAANTSAVMRTGVIEVGGVSLFVSQPPASCAFGLSPQSNNVPAAGGSYSPAVTTGSECRWIPSATPDIFIGISTAASLGSGLITHGVTSNVSSLPRTGNLMVAGEMEQILQKSNRNVQVFQDVTPAHPFFDYIWMVQDKGVGTSCAAGKYCPEDVMSRSQMAAFIIRALYGETFTFNAFPYFSDVPASHPEFKYIQKMKELGITAGCTATAYCPADPVTRGQMAVFIIRARFGLADGGTFPFPSAGYFTDVSSTHPFFSFIQKMKQLGITSGCAANAYCPNDLNTRGQMSVFVTRGLLTP